MVLPGSISKRLGPLDVIFHEAGIRLNLPELLIRDQIVWTSTRRDELTLVQLVASVRLAYVHPQVLVRTSVSLELVARCPVGYNERFDRCSVGFEQHHVELPQLSTPTFSRIVRRLNGI